MQQNRPRGAQVKFSIPWTDRLTRLRFDHGRVVVVLCLACLVGAAWMLQGQVNKAQAQASSQAPVSQFDVKIQGEVLGLSSSQLQQARVTLYFPQLPYQLSRPWAQLEHPKPSSFVVPLQIKAAGAASLCELRLQIGEKVLRGRKVQVEATARTVTLPPLQAKL